MLKEFASTWWLFCCGGVSVVYLASAAWLFKELKSSSRAQEEREKALENEERRRLQPFEDYLSRTKTH